MDHVGVILSGVGTQGTIRSIMNDSDSTGERIKKAREDKGWSHKKLAQELLSHVQSPSSVDSVKRNIIRWENDEHGVSKDFSAALATALGVEVDPSEILTKMNERRRGVEKMMSRSGLKIRDWSSEQHRELYESVLALARAYLSQPIYKIYKDMAALQDKLVELKDRVIINYQPDIYFWLSVVTGIFANAGHDLGHPRMAIAYARWARDLAAETGCAPLQAWTFGMLSLIEYRWSPGDPTHLSLAAPRIEVVMNSDSLHSGRLIARSYASWSVPPGTATR
jgi:transcriptional regulator with XRE-family HTH domain